MRLAKRGHRKIASVYLGRYGKKSAWREDSSPIDNDRPVLDVVSLAMKAKPSGGFARVLTPGYVVIHRKRRTAFVRGFLFTQNRRNVFFG